MREIIKILAKKFDTVAASKRMLLYAGIPDGDIEFSAARDDNWANIISKVIIAPELHLKLYKAVIEEGLSQNAETVIKQKIEELKANLRISRTMNDPIFDPLDANTYNLDFVFGNSFPFLNREKVRNELRKMLTNPTNSKVLIIEGQDKSGMSRTHHYIADIINRFNVYELLQIGPDFKGRSNLSGYRDNTDLMNEISAGLQLDFEVERVDSSNITKTTTFFTKLKEYKSIKNKIPVICLDGIYKLSAPSIHSFVEELIHEANTYKKYYVILANKNVFEAGDIQIKANWRMHLRNFPTINLGSFREEDVKTFIGVLFDIYQDKLDLGDNSEAFYQEFLENNASEVHFEPNRLNVVGIGAACRRLYQNLRAEV